MRLRFSAIVFPALWAVCAGCTPQPADPNDGGLLTAVAGITETNAATPEASAASSAPAADAPTFVQGSLTSSDEYRMIPLGAGTAGEQWVIGDGSSVFGGSAFLVVLFDDQYNLLQRQVVSASIPLEHIVRADTSALYLGVAPASAGSAADFRFEVRRGGVGAIPELRSQVVWLNFAGGTNIPVHGRSGISFTPFDAGELGSQYAGATEVIKAGILAAVREDYAAYNVTVLSSDDGPPPTGAYATVHFGGSDDRLLGLADNVDQYNADPRQGAMIYVESFADFAVMRLTDEEMAQMVGNVAAHEFGHLLGLFHTRVPTDLMDTTGTAWDLAADQSFSRATLEPSVFPFGFENSPAKLAHTVGVKPGGAESGLAKPAITAKMRHKLELRALVQDELRYRCGNCQHPDE